MFKAYVSASLFLIPPRYRCRLHLGVAFCIFPVLRELPDNRCFLDDMILNVLEPRHDETIKRDFLRLAHRSHPFATIPTILWMVNSHCYASFHSPFVLILNAGKTSPSDQPLASAEYLCFKNNRTFSHLSAFRVLIQSVTILLMSADRLRPSVSAACVNACFISGSRRTKVTAFGMSALVKR